MSSAEEYKNQGNEAFKRGEFESAVGLYSLAIEQDQSNHVLFSNKSGALINLGKFQEALEAAESCLRINP